MQVLRGAGLVGLQKARGKPERGITLQGRCQVEKAVVMGNGQGNARWRGWNPFFCTLTQKELLTVIYQPQELFFLNVGKLPTPLVVIIRPKFGGINYMGNGHSHLG